MPSLPVTHYQQQFGAFSVRSTSKFFLRLKPHWPTRLLCDFLAHESSILCRQLEGLVMLGTRRKPELSESYRKFSPTPTRSAQDAFGSFW